MAKTKSPRGGNKPTEVRRASSIVWFALGMIIGVFLFACADGKVSNGKQVMEIRKLGSLPTQPTAHGPAAKENVKISERDAKNFDEYEKEVKLPKDKVEEVRMSNKDWTTCLPDHSETLDIIYKAAVDSEDEAVKQVVRKAVMESQESAVKAIVDEIRKNRLQAEAIKAIQDYDSERFACLVEDLDDVDAVVSDPSLPSDDYMSKSTLLHWTAFYDAFECTEVLVEAEATIDVKNGYRATPLHVASAYGSTSVAKILLKSGAVIEAIDGSEMTPLCTAAESKPSQNVIRLLLAKGAAVDGFCGSSSLRESPLIWAACYGTATSAEILIAAGANPSFKNKHGETPLHYAAYYCNLGVAKVLVAAGASKTVKDGYGKSPAYRKTGKCHSDQSAMDDLFSP